jgi:hypothetical protein
MKNAHPINDEAGAPGKGAISIAAFQGTDNPRHLRAIHALLRRPMPREQLDREAGASNGPALVAELRDRGLDLPCDRVPCLDRDGREVRRGIYNLTQRDRIRIARWLARRARGGEA